MSTQSAQCILASIQDNTLNASPPALPNDDLQFTNTVLNNKKKDHSYASSFSVKDDHAPDQTAVKVSGLDNALIYQDSLAVQPMECIASPSILAELLEFCRSSETVKTEDLEDPNVCQPSVVSTAVEEDDNLCVLVFHKPNLNYMAGEQIKGTIFLCLFGEQPVSVLQMHLQGVCKLKLSQPDDQATCERLLFKQTCKLFSAVPELPDHTLPSYIRQKFQFDLPVDARSTSMSPVLTVYYDLRLEIIYDKVKKTKDLFIMFLEVSGAPYLEQGCKKKSETLRGTMDIIGKNKMLKGILMVDAHFPSTIAHVSEPFDLRLRMTDTHGDSRQKITIYPVLKQFITLDNSPDIFQNHVISLQNEAQSRVVRRKREAKLTYRLNLEDLMPTTLPTEGQPGCSIVDVEYVLSIHVMSEYMSQPFAIISRTISLVPEESTCVNATLAMVAKTLRHYYGHDVSLLNSDEEDETSELQQVPTQQTDIDDCGFQSTKASDNHNNEIRGDSENLIKPLDTKAFITDLFYDCGLIYAGINVDASGLAQEPAVKTYFNCRGQDSLWPTIEEEEIIDSLSEATKDLLDEAHIKLDSVEDRKRALQFLEQVIISQVDRLDFETKGDCVQHATDYETNTPAVPLPPSMEKVENVLPNTDLLTHNERDNVHTCLQHETGGQLNECSTSVSSVPVARSVDAMEPASAVLDVLALNHNEIEGSGRDVISVPVARSVDAMEPASVVLDVLALNHNEIEGSGSDVISVPVARSVDAMEPASAVLDVLAFNHNEKESAGSDVISVPVARSVDATEPRSPLLGVLTLNYNEKECFGSDVTSVSVAHSMDAMEHASGLAQEPAVTIYFNCTGQDSLWPTIEEEEIVDSLSEVTKDLLDEAQIKLNSVEDRKRTLQFFEQIIISHMSEVDRLDRLDFESQWTETNVPLTEGDCVQHATDYETNTPAVPLPPFVERVNNVLPDTDLLTRKENDSEGECESTDYETSTSAIPLPPSMEKVENVLPNTDLLTHNERDNVHTCTQHETGGQLNECSTSVSPVPVARSVDAMEPASAVLDVLALNHNEIECSGRDVISVPVVPSVDAMEPASAVLDVLALNHNEIECSGRDVISVPVARSVDAMEPASPLLNVLTLTHNEKECSGIDVINSLTPSIHQTQRNLQCHVPKQAVDLNVQCQENLVLGQYECIQILDGQVFDYSSKNENQHCISPNGYIVKEPPHTFPAEVTCKDELPTFPSEDTSKDEHQPCPSPAADTVKDPSLTSHTEDTSKDKPQPCTSPAGDNVKYPLCVYPPEDTCKDESLTFYAGVTSRDDQPCTSPARDIVKDPSYTFLVDTCKDESLTFSVEDTCKDESFTFPAEDTSKDYQPCAPPAGDTVNDPSYTFLAEDTSKDYQPCISSARDIVKYPSYTFSVEDTCKDESLTFPAKDISKYRPCTPPAGDTLKAPSYTFLAEDISKDNQPCISSSFFAENTCKDESLFSPAQDTSGDEQQYNSPAGDTVKDQLYTFSAEETCKDESLNFLADDTSKDYHPSTSPTGDIVMNPSYTFSPGDALKNYQPCTSFAGDTVEYSSYNFHTEKTCKNAFPAEDTSKDDKQYTFPAEDTSQDDQQYTFLAEDTIKHPSYTFPAVDTYNDESLTFSSEDTYKDYQPCTSPTGDTVKNPSYTSLAEDTPRDKSLTFPAEEISKDEHLTFSAEDTLNDTCIFPAEDIGNDESFTVLTNDAYEDKSFSLPPNDTSKDAFICESSAKKRKPRIAERFLDTCKDESLTFPAEETSKYEHLTFRVDTLNDSSCTFPAENTGNDVSFSVLTNDASEDKSFSLPTETSKESFTCESSTKKRKPRIAERFLELKSKRTLSEQQNSNNFNSLPSSNQTQDEKHQKNVATFKNTDADEDARSKILATDDLARTRSRHTSRVMNSIKGCEPDRIVRKPSKVIGQPSPDLSVQDTPSLLTKSSTKTEKNSPIDQQRNVLQRERLRYCASGVNSVVTKEETTVPCVRENKAAGLGLSSYTITDTTAYQNGDNQYLPASPDVTASRETSECLLPTSIGLTAATNTCVQIYHIAAVTNARVERFSTSNDTAAVISGDDQTAHLNKYQSNKLDRGCFSNTSNSVSQNHNRAETLVDSDEFGTIIYTLLDKLPANSKPITILKRGKKARTNFRKKVTNKCDNGTLTNMNERNAKWDLVYAELAQLLPKDVSAFHLTSRMKDACESSTNWSESIVKKHVRKLFDEVVCDRTVEETKENSKDPYLRKGAIALDREQILETALKLPFEAVTKYITSQHNEKQEVLAAEPVPVQQSTVPLEGDYHRLLKQETPLKLHHTPPCTMTDSKSEAMLIHVRPRGPFGVTQFEDEDALWGTDALQEIQRQHTGIWFHRRNLWSSKFDVFGDKDMILQRHVMSDELCHGALQQAQNSQVPSADEITAALNRVRHQSNSLQQRLNQNPHEWQNLLLLEMHEREEEELRMALDATMEKGPRSHFDIWQEETYQKSEFSNVGHQALPSVANCTFPKGSSYTDVTYPQTSCFSGTEHNVRNRQLHQASVASNKPQQQAPSISANGNEVPNLDKTWDSSVGKNVSGINTTSTQASELQELFAQMRPVQVPEVLSTHYPQIPNSAHHAFTWMPKDFTNPSSRASCDQPLYSHTVPSHRHSIQSYQRQGSVNVSPETAILLALGCDPNYDHGFYNSGTFHRQRSNFNHASSKKGSYSHQRQNYSTWSTGNGQHRPFVSRNAQGYR